MDKEIAEEIIRENRYPSGYDIQDYLFDNEDTVLSLEDGTELLDDFDLWKERSDLELEKIMDRNYWSSTGGYGKRTLSTAQGIFQQLTRTDRRGKTIYPGAERRVFPYHVRPPR